MVQGKINRGGHKSPTSTTLIVAISMGDNMACVFWYSQGLILVDFVPPGITVNANYYTSLLSDQLHPAIKESNLVGFNKV